MDWITDRIAIGNHLDARNVDLLKQHGFRSALSLDGTLSESDAAKLGLSEVACYPLVDGPGNDLRVLRFAVADLRRMAESQGPTLVQCHAGRSRSAVVVAAYLMETCGIDAKKAVACVAARRDINITPALIVMLRKLEAQ